MILHHCSFKLSYKFLVCCNKKRKLIIYFDIINLMGKWRNGRRNTLKMYRFIS